MTPAGRDADGFELASAVGGADPALLLPARRAGEESRLVLPVRLVDAVALPVLPGSSPSWAAVVADAAGVLLAVPLTHDRAARGGVRRARSGDGAAQALLTLLAMGTDSPTFHVTALHPLTPVGESALDVDQTHDSVVVGSGSADAVVVKWAVHVEAMPGPPASVAALQHLDAVGFTQTPTPVGFLTYAPHGSQVLVASVARFLPGAQDGWDWYVDDLVAHLSGGLGTEAVRQPAAEIGAVVARLHGAFGTAWSGCADPVTAASAADVDRWLRRALTTIDDAAELTAGAPGARFRRRAAVARSVVGGGLRSATGTAMTRVHGDLHVGQVLRWDGGYAVSDFDGNPVLPASERDRPQPPARDVAGMLRALDHVGRIVDRRTDHAFEERVRGWTAAVRASFLATYRAGLAGSPGGPALFDERLLPAFEVEQECRELVYAARHLPRWAYVPDAALTELLPEGPV